MQKERIIYVVYEEQVQEYIEANIGRRLSEDEMSILREGIATDPNDKIFEAIVDLAFTLTEQNLPTQRPLHCKALSSKINKRYGSKK